MSEFGHTPPRLDAAESLRRLPSVDSLLRQAAIATLLDEYPRSELVTAARSVLDARRQAILTGEPTDPDPATLALDVRQTLQQRARPSLRRVINATGVVLHTGLGRSPLAPEAIEAVTAIAGGYSNLELNLETGERGDRHEHVRSLLCELTGAEDALVVNNNAAGTYLALRALAAGREVIVSRGELVEIGGSYRMPEIMAAAGCRMVEVGTTNRTRISDYAAAVNEHTAALLRVHTSNYRIIGFTESAPLADLARLAHEHPSFKTHLIDDLGSGLLVPGLLPAPEHATDASAQDGDGAAPDETAWCDEPAVCDSVAAGADLTLFSGDKLLGGPQAGLIVGRTELIRRLRAEPLMRALRPDKLTLAALEATLRLYRDPAALARTLPVQRMLATPLDRLESAATKLAEELSGVADGANATAAQNRSYVGGGSLPGVAWPTWIVRFRVPGTPAAALAAALRRGETPVICRLHDDALVIDLRTVDDGDAATIVTAVAAALRDLCP